MRDDGEDGGATRATPRDGGMTAVSPFPPLLLLLPPVSSVPLHSSFSPTLAEPSPPSSLTASCCLLTSGTAGEKGVHVNSPDRCRRTEVESRWEKASAHVVHPETPTSPPLHPWIHSAAQPPKPQRYSRQWLRHEHVHMSVGRPETAA